MLTGLNLLSTPWLHAQAAVEIQTLYSEAKAAQAAGDLPAAIAKYQQLIRVAPRLAPAYNNLGMLYEQTRQYPLAIEVLKRSRAIDPSVGASSALLGIAFFETGDMAQARLALEAALKANANDEHAELLLSQVLLRSKEYELASQHLRHLTAHQPNDQQVWYLLGQAYMQLSQQALTRMQAIDPASVLVHEMSGKFMEDMQNYAGAAVEYKKAVEMAPQKPGTHFGLGMVYWNQSNWDAAMQEFRSELANDSGNCDARAKISSILLEQQQFQPALTEAESALKLCPGSLEAHVDRGRALQRLDRNPEAIAELTSVVKSNPGDQTAHFYLGRAYRATGNRQAAKTEIETYQRLESGTRQKAASRLEEVIHSQEPPSGSNQLPSPASNQQPPPVKGSAGAPPQ